MSIEVLYGGDTILISGEESAKSFRELVFRATNLWPDAPPEIKRFSDLLIHGKELQDYDSQNRDQTSRRHVHSHRCSCGYTSRISTNNPNPPTYPVTCHNEAIRLADIDKEGNPYVRLVSCKRLEMFNPAINEAP